MRAIQIQAFGDPSNMRLVNVDEPTPGPGQVAIRVSHAGINFADVMTRKGLYHRAGPPPLIPGLEVAGEVIALGEGVVTPTIGTRVAARTNTGGYAEVALASSELTYAIPDTVDGPRAASLSTIVPAGLLLCDEVARLRTNDSVLINAAAGGVGMVLAQMARLRGADPIIGTVGSAAKQSIAAGYGYDAVFLTDDIATVRDATNGRGVDVVFDSVGGAVRDACTQLLAPMGRLIAFGNASTEAERTQPAEAMRTQNSGYIGFSMGTLTGSNPAKVRRATRDGIQLVGSGTVRIDVTETYPLAEAATAHQRLEARATTGKLVLAMEA
ncbi:MAG: zinc-binding dehydrogenase [Nitriliruptoraceae bacterium]